MFFQTDGGAKVICSLRVPFPAGTLNVIEQSEVGLTDPGVPARQKVVDGVIVSKTAQEYQTEMIAAWTATVKWISKYYIIQRMKALGKYTEGIAMLKSDDAVYQEWLAAQDISRADTNVNSMLTALGITMDTLLTGYYDYVQSLNPLR